MAEELWILQTGPESVDSIPLDPLQPVPSWRGLYEDGQDRIWLYATRSPNFYPSANPDIHVVTGTVWTVVTFFPPSWTGEKRKAWFDTWVVEFRTLSSLPDPGWPILFPSVLRKS